jgi:hypothetical protein
VRNSPLQASQFKACGGIQTVLDEKSLLDCVDPAMGMPTKCPLFHSDLGVIGMAKGLKNR